LKNSQVLVFFLTFRKWSVSKWWCFEERRSNPIIYDVFMNYN